MGNRTTFGVLFFASLVFSNLSWGAGSSATVNCPVQSLSYCFPNNINATKCVTATSDAEASAKCGPGATYWNLSNPVYKVSSPANVWMCSNNQSKMAICKNAPSDKKLNWEGSANSGDCYQIINGKKDICSFGDLAKSMDPEVECTAEHFVPNPSSDKSQARCICETGYEQSGSECKKKAVTAATPAPAGASEKMKQCVAKHEDIAKTCEDSAAKAVKTCNQKDESNPEVVSALSLPTQVANQFVQAKSGSVKGGGILNECFEAGALTNGSKLLMQEMAVKCKDSFTTCTETCIDDKYQAFLQECGKVVTDNATQDQLDTIKEGGSVPDNDYLKTAAAKMEKQYSISIPKCKVEAVQHKSVLDGVLNGLAGALQASMSCACKVASSAAGSSPASCDSLPTAAQCLAQPSLAGCAAYAAIDMCTMGSVNYSAAGCACQTNPAGANCGGVATAAATSGFAGADIKDPSSSAAFLPTNSKTGGGAAGDIDLGSANNSGISESTKTGAGGPGFLGGGAGGGGGGSASAPSAGGEPQVARDGDGESKGLLGAFNQAKSMVSSLMGGSKPAASAAGGGKLDGKVDPNKFRPNGLRGVANANGLGGKNKNIFEMMQDQYDILQPTLPSVQGH